MDKNEIALDILYSLKSEWGSMITFNTTEEDGTISQELTQNGIRIQEKLNKILEKWDGNQQQT